MHCRVHDEFKSSMDYMRTCIEEEKEEEESEGVGGRGITVIINALFPKESFCLGTKSRQRIEVNSSE